MFNAPEHLAQASVEKSVNPAATQQGDFCKRPRIANAVACPMQSLRGSAWKSPVAQTLMRVNICTVKGHPIKQPEVRGAYPQRSAATSRT
jgi:hypothetical protein